VKYTCMLVLLTIHLPAFAAAVTGAAHHSCPHSVSVSVGVCLRCSWQRMQALVHLLAAACHMASPVVLLLLLLLLQALC
jgi:hypothetical protein